MNNPQLKYLLGFKIESAKIIVITHQLPKLGLYRVKFPSSSLVMYDSSKYMRLDKGDLVVVLSYTLVSLEAHNSTWGMRMLITTKLETVYVKSTVWWFDSHLERVLSTQRMWFDD